MDITVEHADQIIGVMKRVRTYGPKSFNDWIKDGHDGILHATLFDVKMGVFTNKTNCKRPVTLYSYGSKAWSNCIAFLLRMHFNNLAAQTI
jgi:hypothetical protein